MFHSFIDSFIQSHLGPRALDGLFHVVVEVGHDSVKDMPQLLMQKHYLIIIIIIIIIKIKIKKIKIIIIEIKIIKK